LANVGGDAWVDKLDIEPLRGRRVVCLAFKMINDDETRESYQSTLKLASRLDAIGIAPEFSLLNFGRSLLLPNPKPSNLPVLISEMKVEAPPIGQREFLKMAEAAGACIPPPLRLDRYGAIDIEVEQRAAPLIKNLVYSGETTVIVEHENVEPNLISRVIVALSNNVEGFAISHWKNVAVGKVGCIVFIDVEHKKRYTRKLLELGDLANGKPILYDTRLFEQPEDECLKELKQVAHKNSPRVVVFDAESLWTEGSGRIAVLRKFMRHCLEKSIALVVILRDGKLMNHLSTPNRMIDVWEKLKGEFAYIVESHEHGVEHFCMAYEDQVDNGKMKLPRWISAQTRSVSVLVSRTVDQNTLNKVDERMRICTEDGVVQKADESV